MDSRLDRLFRRFRFLNNDREGRKDAALGLIDLGYPASGLAFIRHVETVERYANSPIIVTPKTRDHLTRCQFIVTAVGDYEYCADVEDCGRHHDKRGRHPHRLVEGDWVLVRNRSWSLTPDPDIYVIRQGYILGKFKESIA